MLIKSIFHAVANQRKSPAKILSVVLLLSLLLAGQAITPVRAAPPLPCYVDARKTTGGNDGSSWTDAYTDLQIALRPSASCVEIWVAAGVYKPDGGLGDRTLSFMLQNDVSIYGGFAGKEQFLGDRDPATNVTTLSGEIGAGTTDDNSIHVVTGATGATLDGFTITAGNANAGSGPDYADSSGGGMYNSSSSPTLTNLIFDSNSAAVFGGGMYNTAGSSPALQNVTFSANLAPYGAGMSTTVPSGAACNCDPTLTNVTFSANISSASGGGMYNGYASAPTLTNVTFSGNTASAQGGGIDSVSSSPTLTNVTFHLNSATSGGGMASAYGIVILTNVTFSANTADYGGGTRNSGGSPTLTNVTFSGNHGVYGGGMINSDNSNPTLTNVTFHGNTGDHGGAMYNNPGSSPLIYDSIFWGNGSAEIDSSSALTIKDSIVAGGCPVPPGTGCTHVINADPLLGTLGNNNGGFTQTMALGPGSPAIDAGDATSPPHCATTDQNGVTRPQDGACDMGAYEAADSKVPTVASITRADPNPTFASNVRFTVTFSEVVTGVDAPDFSLATTGVSGASVTGVSGTGNTRTVSVNTGTGGGTIRLNVVDDDSIIDRVSKPLGGTGGGNGSFTGGQTYTVQKILTFRSTGSQDGWMLESTETSGMGGGTPNSAATTFNLGDDAKDRQYRAILSFNTAPLPHTAVITKVTLKLRLLGTVGTSPFSTHGNLLVDVRNGAFGSNATLQAGDFEAAASRNAVGTIPKTPISGWYTRTWTSGILGYINGAGVTQLRLRFTKDDNDDMGADYLKFYSGNASASVQPQLIIEYHLP